VADLSESLAAVLLLQCVESRRLDLDVPATQYGVSVPEGRITLRALLSHAAPEGSADPFKFSPERYAQLTPAIESCVPDRPYRKILADRLLDTLAMKDSVPGTDFREPGAIPDDLFEESDLERYRAVLERTAVPYRAEGRGRAEQTTVAPAGVSAATGIVSTVRDLAQFDAALDASQLLRDETRGIAWSPAVTPGGTVLPTGLGWFIQNYRGERVVWQFGAISGAYSSLIVKLPARRLTFILLANSDGLSAPFQLSSGDVTRSVFATLFLRLAT
jgi:CubicO group peptidase (beta-lactamase class C family)